MKKLVVSIALFMMIMGCATPYKKQGFTGGYSETRLDENVFKVTFKGNGYTSRERAADYALLRCAELALECGYPYFIIIESSEYTKESTYTTPTTSQTRGTVQSYGNTAYGEATTMTYGGQTYKISKPRSTNIIVCFNEKPEITDIAYNAAFIQKSISEKYGIRSR